MTILYRTFTTELEVRDDGDGRTLAGLALPYGLEIDLGSYRESFSYGTGFADLNPAQVPLTATHPRDGAELPIGITTELREEQDGLHGTWRVSKVQLGDEVLELARDKVPLGLSIGFIPDEAADRWNRDRTRVERRAALLDHIAVVRSPRLPNRSHRQPTGRSRARNATSTPGPAAAPVSLPRPCLGCGELVRGRPRCPPCTPAKRPNAQRGYGATHNRLRAELVASYHPLDPCPRCDEPLGPDPSLLDLDHTADRRGYLGLSHASCNRAAGARAKF